MKNIIGWIGLAALGLCGACASQDKAPATSADASAANVEAATNTPNTQPNFAPARADGTASGVATPDRTTPPGTNPAPGTSDTVVDNDRSMSASARNARTTTTTGSSGTTGTGSDTNAAYAASRYPSDTTTTGAATNGKTDTSAPDNTRVNKRDQNDAKLLPTDQGNNETDLKITQEIRQALMKDKSLSFGAKNVKIITVNGKVTLRGPVSTAAERSAIEAAARKAAGATQVDNQLELKTDEKK